MGIPDKNTRAAEMWRIINAHVDFKDKKVLDAGCGQGDFLWRMYEAGASYVIGVDADPGTVAAVRERLKDHGYGDAPIRVEVFDLEEWTRTSWRFQDVVLSLSVLPYMKDMHQTLRNLYVCSEVVIIELQYWGDGKGLPIVKDDDDMRELLKWAGWSRIESIGATLVQGRGKMRTIWRCE